MSVDAGGVKPGMHYVPLTDLNSRHHLEHGLILLLVTACLIEEDSQLKDSWNNFSRKMCVFC